MNRRTGGRRAGVTAVLLLVSFAGTSGASPESDLNRIARTVTDLEEELSQLRRSLRDEQLGSPRQVEERLIDAELLFNMQDYERASLLYLDVVDHYQNHPGYPEALFRLGESLFFSRNYYGARTRFQEVVERAGQPGFRGLSEAALGRLIEIAIHTREFEGVDQYFTRFSQMAPAEVTSGTHYARGRLFYHREQYDEAARAFGSVGQGSVEYLRAQYHLGVINVVRREYPQAIEVFSRVVQAQPSTNEDRQVVDLAHIALGALRLEQDQLEEAIRSYQNVNRNSRFFARALYEVAQAYARQGDATRAERALEVLTVAAPDSHYIPRAKILRGNLLLDTGRFEESREVFTDVIGQFRPVRDELDQALSEERDPQVYFQELVRENLEVFDAASFLPELALRWVREEEDFQRAMDSLSGTSTCSRMIGETEQLLARLETAVNGPSAVNVFAGLRGTAQRAVQVENRLAQVRGELLEVEAQVVGGGAAADLEASRAERQQLEEEIRRLPIDGESYENAQQEARSQYRRLAAELGRINARVDRLQATLVALDLYQRQSQERQGAEASPTPAVPEGAEGESAAGVDAFRQELAVHRGAIDDYRTELTALRNLVESGQLQIGVGDAADRRAAEKRARYNDLVRQERELLARQGGGELMRRAEQLFGRVETIQGGVAELGGQLVRRAQGQSSDVRVLLDQERQNLADYTQQLEGLQAEAQEVIGQAVYENFQQVRERFYDLVRQGDVGIIDVAWAEREEHRHRIDYLSEESRRQLQLLDDEFNEVFDEQSSQEEEP